MPCSQKILVASVTFIPSYMYNGNFQNILIPSLCLVNTKAHNFDLCGVRNTWLSTSVITCKNWTAILRFESTYGGRCAILYILSQTLSLAGYFKAHTRLPHKCQMEAKYKVKARSMYEVRSCCIVKKKHVACFIGNFNPRPCAAFYSI